MKHAAAAILFLLLAAPGPGALAEGESLAFEFDGVNVPLAELLEQAKAEKKPVFLDFYLPG